MALGVPGMVTATGVAGSADLRHADAQEEQALKSLIPDSAAVCEEALRDAGIAPHAEAVAAAAALPTPSVVEVPGKPPPGPTPAPAEKMQVRNALLAQSLHKSDLHHTIDALEETLNRKLLSCWSATIGRSL